MKKYHFDEDPLLYACGISVEKQLTKFVGRVLNAPKVLCFSCNFLGGFIRTFTYHFHADCS